MANERAREAAQVPAEELCCPQAMHLGEAEEEIMWIAESAVDQLCESSWAVQKFCQVCADGWIQGWHERNGGNLTCLLDAGQEAVCRRFFDEEPREWVELASPVPQLGGRILLTTASGAHLKNVPLLLEKNAGMVEIAADGCMYRMVWGFADGGRPTSEISAHVSCLAARQRAGYSANVVYHAHPSNLIAMTLLKSWNDRTLTQILWSSMAECIIAAPYGVSVAGWITPGTAELAQACQDAMGQTSALVMAQHGVFCSGVDFDDAFSLLHTLDKAAGIYLTARAANGGSDEFANGIPLEGLKDIAQRYGLPANPEFLLD